MHEVWVGNMMTPYYPCLFVLFCTLVDESLLICVGVSFLKAAAVAAAPLLLVPKRGLLCFMELKFAEQDSW